LDSDDEDTVKSPPPSSPKKVSTSSSTGKQITARGVQHSQEKHKSVRGGKEGRGGRGGRREFDRKSGTGHGREGIKHGGGKHNWGNENDQTALEEEAQVEGEDETTEDLNKASEEVEEVEEEEEEVQMTLEEYQAQLLLERSGENFAALKVREIENDFADQISLRKEDKTPDFMEAKYEKVFRERSSGRKGKTTVIKDVGFRAPPTYEQRRDRNDQYVGGRRGGRGGRGGGRRGGRGGRGGGRGGSRRAPNVSDMNAFPTLG